MGVTWETARKSLVDIEKAIIPKPLIIELRFYDDNHELERSKICTVDEIINGTPASECQWFSFKVISGSDTKQLKKLLAWVSPESIIKGVD